VVAQEIEVPLSPAQVEACRVRATLPALYFCEDLKGYGWVFRKGNFLNVGLGRQDPTRFSDRVRRFKNWLAASGEIPLGVSEQWCGHAYLLWGQPRRPCLGEGVLLVGDAAGLAVPASGEGIRTAVESGRLAARAIVAANGDYTRDRLDAYAASLEARFGPPPHARGHLAWLPDGVAHAFGTRLIGTRWFARHVLAARWFLQMNEPALT